MRRPYLENDKCRKEKEGEMGEKKGILPGTVVLGAGLVSYSDLDLVIVPTNYHAQVR